MPPKRRPAGGSSQAARPLDGFTVVLSGRFSPYGLSHASLEKLVRSLGGKASRNVGPGVTHLVCTEQDFNDGAIKVAAARAQGTPLVQPDWVVECERQQRAVPTDSYLWTAAAAANGGGGGTKRAASSSSGGDGDGGDGGDGKPAAKKPRAPGTDSDRDADTVMTDGPSVKRKDAVIPLDKHCTLQSFQVHIDPDTGTFLDASLNQSSASNNHNKFYIVQVIRDPSGDTYRTWTRWGRIGEVGQGAALGNGSLADAITVFERKFREKTGLPWDRRGDDPKPGKYAFVERCYSDDDDDDDDDAGAGAGDGEGAAASADAPPRPPKCTLARPVQQLMELIFNQNYLEATMASLNYDANKLPLGKLSQATITRGFHLLKDLAAVIDDPTKASSKWAMSEVKAKEHLSDMYYSIIPHDFGRKRPPVILDRVLLRREIELLDSLSDMREAAALMEADGKAVATVHPQDVQFQSLGLDEMTPLDPSSNEYARLRDYLTDSRGATHYVNYQVQHIFRIERRGERARLDATRLAGSDRRLLWHGSRCTNFAGILSQGLRIAPPEAPVQGYMFGKGIYLADMSSKSANYCFPTSFQGHALLLLCEAELGAPMLSFKYSCSTAGDKAAQKGMASSWGMGETGPGRWMDAGVVHESLAGVKMPDTSLRPGPTGIRDTALLYNEYICYDVAQVRMRYLFHVVM